MNYVLADFVSTNIAWLLFNVVRYTFIESNELSFHSLSDFLTSTTVLLGQLVLPLMMLAIYYLSGYYNKVFLKSRLQEFITTAGSAFVGMV